VTVNFSIFTLSRLRRLWSRLRWLRRLWSRLRWLRRLWSRLRWLRRLLEAFDLYFFFTAN